MTEEEPEVVPPLGHGNCPHCNTSLDGGGIWQHFYDQFITEGDWLDREGNFVGLHNRCLLTPVEAEVRADAVAANYGASRTKGRWGRVVGIERDRDRIEEWACPDCGGMWSRDTGELLDTKWEGFSASEREGFGHG